MASFCGNCGAPLGGAFCIQCGASAAARPSQPPPPPPPPVPVPAPQSNTALKIILVLVCCLAVGGVAVVGGLYYLAHRVKQAVIEKAAERGVDLTSITTPTPRDGAAARPLPKPCEVLSKDAVAQLIGEPIERAEVQEVSCMYYGPAGLSAKLAQEQASGTFKRAQAASGKGNNATEVANSVDQLVNSLAAQTGQTGSGGELPLLMLAVSGDGRSQMTAMSATKAIFGGIVQGADAKGVSFGADIPGLGDKAIRLPKLGLNVLKGDTIICIIPGPFPDADHKCIAVARAVLPKI